MKILKAAALVSLCIFALAFAAGIFAIIGAANNIPSHS